MNTTGREQVGVLEPELLIAGNRHPVDVCHVVIQEGQNLKRGTLLELAAAAEGEESTEAYVIRGTSEDAVAAYVLADDTDATEGDTVAAAYRSGEFAENMLIVKDGFTLTTADKNALRDAGIFLTKVMV